MAFANTRNFFFKKLAFAKKNGFTKSNDFH